MALDAIGNQATYSLSDFEIVYPYDDPRDEVLSSNEQATVTFDAHWPSGVFPGGADCRLTLAGADGTEVGALDFRLVSGTDGATSGPLTVSVSGRPTSGSGSCEDVPEELSTGSGYEFTGPTKVSAAVEAISGEEIPNITELDFDVRWEESGSNPGMRTCYLVVSRSDGTEDSPVKYNVLAGEGPMTFDVEGTPDTITGGKVTCGPFEG